MFALEIILQISAIAGILLAAIKFCFNIYKELEDNTKITRLLSKEVTQIKDAVLRLKHEIDSNKELLHSTLKDCLKHPRE